MRKIREIHWGASFKRSFKQRVRCNSKLEEKFWQRFEIFHANPFDKLLKTHKLSGKLEGLWSFSVSYDCRIIFKFVNDKEILLIDIGTHSDIY